MRLAVGARGVIPRAVPAVSAFQARTMATEKDIRMRIESTSSIKKITSSMKMVAAAKMRGAERNLAQGKLFGKIITNAAFPEQADMENPDIVGNAGDNHLFIAVTSDKGLCGGVNSTVVRTIRKWGDELKAQKKNFKIFIIGDKGKGGLMRLFPKNVVGGVDQCYPKGGTTFPMASAIGQRILAYDFDTASITYNEFVSAVQYDTLTRELVSLELKKDVAEGEEPTPAHLVGYEVGPEDKEEALRSLYEYSIATTVFGCMLENSVSELSARMNAMENASKNAGEMIDKLTLQYNRARQSRITTELIEIISGAESLKG